jgi:N-acetylglucosaminyl-diphospho-decaprenol L-rhamnosyltransferase
MWLLWVEQLHPGLAAGRRYFHPPVRHGRTQGHPEDEASGRRLEMTTTRRVAAVVVHYGDPGRTVRAVLARWNLNVFSRIIVVANDLSERPPDLTDEICSWIVPGRNLGFGGACQFAAATYAADVYAFFNAHVTMDSRSVRNCVVALDIPGVGITAPFVHLPATGNPKVDWKYTWCVRKYSRTTRLPIQVPLPQYEGYESTSSGCATRALQSADEVIDNEWVTGCAIFCRSEIIRDIGWDGSYFLTWEDADISIRAIRSGWRVVTVPSALAYHSGESTRARTMSAYYCMRNPIWFSRKYRSRPRQVLLTSYLFLLLLRITAADVLQGRRPRHAPLAARGLLDGWALWPSGKDPLPGEPLRFTATVNQRTTNSRMHDRHQA